jgi:hypothetical protein
VKSADLRRRPITVPLGGLVSLGVMHFWGSNCLLLELIFPWVWAFNDPISGALQSPLL